jgi:isopenicillin N synthase-like dioxygenase
VSDELVPLVDLSQWNHSADDRVQLARVFDAACSRSGFLHVSGHGIDQSLLQRVRASAQAFFDLPLDEKMRYLSPPEHNRGYSPIGREALAYSDGIDTPPDLFEAFIIGNPRNGPTSDAIDAYNAPNVWPDRPDMFRDVWEAYWQACERLGHTLLQIAAVALALPEDHFMPFVARSTNALRALNYPALDYRPESGQFRIGPHTDYGAFTILLADDVAGLEILDGRGEWRAVDIVDGAFVVNLGDLLSEWTNDRWRSTAHRVVVPDRAEPGAPRRISVAYFQQPDPEAVIEVLPTCVSSDRPARYAKITAGQHLLSKLSRQYLDRSTG